VAVGDIASGEDLPPVKRFPFVIKDLVSFAGRPNVDPGQILSTGMGTSKLQIIHMVTVLV
jgi:hypothetical protein